MIATTAFFERWVTSVCAFKIVPMQCYHTVQVCLLRSANITLLINT